MHSFQNFHSSTKVLVPRQIRTESDKALIQRNRRLEVWRFKILLRCACTALDHQYLVLVTFKISEIQTYTNRLLYAFENTHTLRHNFYAITFSSKQIQQCQMLLKVSAKCKHAKTWYIGNKSSRVASGCGQHTHSPQWPHQLPYYLQLCMHEHPYGTM